MDEVVGLGRGRRLIRFRGVGGRFESRGRDTREEEDEVRRGVDSPVDRVLEEDGDEGVPD